MRYIKLTQGKRAMVDDDDFEFLNQWKWYLLSTGYAVRDIGGGKNKKTILMHNLIMGNRQKGKEVDHQDRNKLNNTRKNLRMVTRSENIINSGLRSDSTSGYRGVNWYKNYKSWRVRITKDGKTTLIGYFKSKSEAINRRKQAELKIWN